MLIYLTVRSNGLWSCVYVPCRVSRRPWDTTFALADRVFQMERVSWDGLDFIDLFVRRRVVGV